MAPKQSCKVVKVAVAEPEVDVDVEAGVVLPLPLQAPKPGWHPVPQYDVVGPLLKISFQDSTGVVHVKPISILAAALPRWTSIFIRLSARPVR